MADAPGPAHASPSHIARCSCGWVLDEVDRIRLRDGVDVPLALAANYSLIIAIDHLDKGHVVSVGRRFLSVVTSAISRARAKPSWVNIQGVTSSLEQMLGRLSEACS